MIFCCGWTSSGLQSLLDSIHASGLCWRPTVFPSNTEVVNFNGIVHGGGLLGSMLLGTLPALSVQDMF